MAIPRNRVALCIALALVVSLPSSGAVAASLRPAKPASPANAAHRPGAPLGTGGAKLAPRSNPLARSAGKLRRRQFRAATVSRQPAAFRPAAPPQSASTAEPELTLVPMEPKAARSPGGPSVGAEGAAGKPTFLYRAGYSAGRAAGERLALRAAPAPAAGVEAPRGGRLRRIGRATVNGIKRVGKATAAGVRRVTAPVRRALAVRSARRAADAATTSARIVETIASVGALLRSGQLAQAVAALREVPARATLTSKQRRALKDARRAIVRESIRLIRTRATAGSAAGVRDALAALEGMREAGKLDFFERGRADRAKRDASRIAVDAARHQMRIGALRQSLDLVVVAGTLGGGRATMKMASALATSAIAQADSFLELGQGDGVVAALGLALDAAEVARAPARVILRYRDLGHSAARTLAAAGDGPNALRTMDLANVAGDRAGVKPTRARRVKMQAWADVAFRLERAGAHLEHPGALDAAADAVVEAERAGAPANHRQLKGVRARLGSTRMAAARAAVAGMSAATAGMGAGNPMAATAGAPGPGEIRPPALDDVAAGEAIPDVPDDDAPGDG